VENDDQHTPWNLVNALKGSSQKNPNGIYNVGPEGWGLTRFEDEDER